MSLTLDIEDADKVKEAVLTLIKNTRVEEVSDILKAAVDSIADHIADLQVERERIANLSQRELRTEFGGDQL